MIDLRSDTVTRPTDEMLQAMMRAPVGDDVWGDDPTVNRLQDDVASLLGYEAALFFPSGTMSNQVALRAHTEPGQEIFIHRDSHIHYYECGAPAALSGITSQLLDGERGFFSASDLDKAIRPSFRRFSKPSLVVVENTHNRGGGTVAAPEYLESIAQVAQQKQVRMHCDGARLWHAAVALDIPVSDLTKPYFDSVSVCFSKGLGCPVGSALLGNKDFIERARWFRDMFGGGMRQAGFLAAAARYALDHHRRRLAEDHDKAHCFYRVLAERLPAILLKPEPETNMVGLRLPKPVASEILKSCVQRGVALSGLGYDIRAVMHLDVRSSEVEIAAVTLADVVAQWYEYEAGTMLSE